MSTSTHISSGVGDLHCFTIYFSILITNLTFLIFPCNFFCNIMTGEFAHTVLEERMAIVFV